MASRKRGPGRPRNPVRSAVIPVTVPRPIYDLMGTIATVEGTARATWARQELLKAVDRHGRRVARL